VPLPDTADLVELPSAEGGLPKADDAAAVVDADLEEPRDFADCDFTGE
jgi:hypothetical protein